ncbi:MAG: hypothetical protein ABFE13_06780 [Phycisphaerales bacterium]
MADLNLTQAEADALIAMEKHRVDEDPHDFPMAGDSLVLPLQSSDKRELFSLDISRGRIDLLRGKYQNRARQVIVLVRLDFGGRPHRNPDDQELPCPHLHVYKEGYGHKWAIPVPLDQFNRISDLYGTLEDFMRFCNITQPPRINRGLFT